MRALLGRTVVYWQPFLLGVAGWLISGLILDALFMQPDCGGPAGIIPYNAEPDNELVCLARAFDQMALTVLWFLFLVPVGCGVAGWRCSMVGRRRGSTRAAFVSGLLGALAYPLMKLALMVISPSFLGDPSLFGFAAIFGAIALGLFGIAYVVGFANGIGVWDGTSLAPPSDWSPWDWPPWDWPPSDWPSQDGPRRSRSSWPEIGSSPSPGSSATSGAGARLTLPRSGKRRLTRGYRREAHSSSSHRTSHTAPGPPGKRAVSGGPLSTDPDRSRDI